MSVTGLIVAYNAAETIVDAVQSLMDQVDHLIVVDDGSSDGTSDILRGAVPGVQIITLEENKGVGAARQIALDAVKTEWLVWQDADDLSMAGRVAALLHKADLGADLVFDCAQLVDPVSHTVKAVLTPPDVVRTPAGLAMQLARNHIPVHWPLEQTSLARAVGFQADLHQAEDFDHQLRAVLRGARIDWVTEPSYRYRDDPASLSRNIKGQEAAYRLCLQRIGLEEARSFIQRSGLQGADAHWIELLFRLRREEWESVANMAVQVLASGELVPGPIDNDRCVSRQGLFFIRASALMKMTQWAAACDVLEDALDFGERADLLNNLGVARFQGRGEVADHFARALHLIPNYKDAAENAKSAQPSAITLFPLRMATGRSSY